MGFVGGAIGGAELAPLLCYDAHNRLPPQQQQPQLTPSLALLLLPTAAAGQPTPYLHLARAFEAMETTKKRLRISGAPCSRACFACELRKLGISLLGLLGHRP